MIPRYIFISIIFSPQSCVVFSLHHWPISWHIRFTLLIQTLLHPLQRHSFQTPPHQFSTWFSLVSTSIHSIITQTLHFSNRLSVFINVHRVCSLSRHSEHLTVGILPNERIRIVLAQGKVVVHVLVIRVIPFTLIIVPLIIHQPTNILYRRAIIILPMNRITIPWPSPIKVLRHVPHPRHRTYYIIRPQTVHLKFYFVYLMSINWRFVNNFILICLLYDSLN